MFKKLIGTFLIALFCATASGQQWQEGVHYKVLQQKANRNAGVVEIFSYWCPACFAFESMVKPIKEGLPEGIKFSKAHLDTMGFASQEVQEAATKMMLAAKALKQEEAFNEALFNTIHVKRDRPSSVDDLKEIASTAGLPLDRLDKMMNSFGLRSGFKQNKQRIQGFSSVPTIIVNDKYQVTFTRDITPDQIVELIIWLSAQA